MKIDSNQFDGDGNQPVPTVNSTQVNTSTENKFRVDFSKFPNLKGFKIDPQLLTSFLEDIAFPDLPLETIKSTFLRQERHHPMDGGNRDLGAIDLTFKASENLENFIWFRKLIWDLRNGRRPEGFENLVDYLFDYINITVMDNKKRDIYVLHLHHCLPTNSGSIGLKYNSSGERVFTVPFIYHDFEPQMISVYEG